MGHRYDDILTTAQLHNGPEYTTNDHSYYLFTVAFYKIMYLIFRNIALDTFVSEKSQNFFCLG